MNNSTKWRLGPWRATTRQGSWDWVVYTEDDPNIEICQTFHDGTDENEEGEANAHLIAAAPELYEALKAMVALCPPYREEWLTDAAFKEAEEAHETARAALAKARSEQI